MHRTWGPASGRLDLAFDLAAIDAGFDGRSDEADFVMTSDHGDDALDEALWYATFAAFCADPVPECRAVLAITSRDYVEQVERRFADPDRLNRDLLAAEESVQPRRQGRASRVLKYTAEFVIGALIIALLRWAIMRL
jgi:hypothetical protein